MLSPTTENEFDPHSQIEILVLLGVHRSFPTSNPRQFYKGSPPRIEKRILINTECNQFCIKFPQELMVAQGHVSNTNLKRLNNEKNALNLVFSTREFGKVLRPLEFNERVKYHASVHAKSMEKVKKALVSKKVLKVIKHRCLN